MGKLIVIKKLLGLLHTNCYFVGNDQNKEVVIIDPAEDADMIIDTCKQQRLTPVAMLLTHGHFDHIMAAEEIRKAYTIPLYAGADEKILLSDSALYGAGMIRRSQEIAVDYWINDNDRLDLAGLYFEVIATPGHTPGSVCYYIRDENVLFSGDTLFKDSFGRTDFPLGNSTALYQSITQKLFSLPEDTVVYPGHEMQTSIAYEKQHNMILAWPM